MTGTGDGLFVAEAEAEAEEDGAVVGEPGDGEAEGVGRAVPAVACVVRAGSVGVAEPPSDSDVQPVMPITPAENTTPATTVAAVRPPNTAPPPVDRPNWTVNTTEPLVPAPVLSRRA